MSGDDPDETAPFTHRPSGGADRGDEPTHEPFTPPSGPPDPPTRTWETYQQPPQPVYPAAPYGQPPYGQPPYGQMPYGTGLTQHPQANTAMILGIVGLAGTFICGILCVLGPFAWAIGAKVRREIDAEPHRWRGRSEATVGFVTGIITTVLLSLVVLFLILIVGLAASGGLE